MNTPLFASVESGGTKFVCGVGHANAKLLDRIEFPTTDPAQTLRATIDYFKTAEQRFGRLSALGVATFGPADLDPASASYGCITTTPKPGWRDTPILKTLAEALEVPAAIDTDVNGAALAEMRWGAGVGLTSLLYITVGTGIGGGFAQRNGDACVTRKGRLHPEMGHVLVPRIEGDNYAGHCPYHRHCLEGYACGPAIEARWGTNGRGLSPEHPAWELEAQYLARGLASMLFTLAPDRIVLGGGVMQQGAIWPLLLEHLRTELNGYALPTAMLEALDQFVVAPALTPNSGILGGLALAEAAYAAGSSGHLKRA